MVEQALEREQALRAEAGDCDAPDYGSVGIDAISPSATSAASRAGVAAELALDPGVVVDGLEVAGPAVGEDRRAAAARLHLRGERLDGERDAARGGACQDRLALGEPAAADDAVEVGDAHELVEFGARGQIGLDAGAEAGEPAGSAPAAEEGAPGRVHRDDARAAPVLAQVVAAAAQRAGRARGDEEVVEPALERLVDLAHRAGGVRGRVGLVGVLIRPERVGDLGEQLPRPARGARRAGRRSRDPARRRRARRRPARASPARSSRARACRPRRSAACRGSGRPGRARRRCCRRSTRRPSCRDRCSPSSRASCSMRAAGRSLALPPGLDASSFAQSATSGRSR